jgi:hypothetical protein
VLNRKVIGDLVVPLIPPTPWTLFAILGILFTFQ